MPPSVPTCTYCRRPFSDPRGCEYLPGDEQPVIYGEELHPFGDGPTCRDCGTARGRRHHAFCLATECPTCHNQFHPGSTCDEDAKFHAELRTGGTAA